MIKDHNVIHALHMKKMILVQKICNITDRMSSEEFFEFRELIHQLMDEYFTEQEDFLVDLDEDDE